MMDGVLGELLVGTPSTIVLSPRPEERSSRSQRTRRFYGGEQDQRVNHQLGRTCEPDPELCSHHFMSGCWRFGPLAVMSSPAASKTGLSAQIHPVSQTRIRSPESCEDLAILQVGDHGLPWKTCACP